MKFSTAIFKTFFLSLCIIATVSFSYAQTASILPPAKTTFVDQNGKPLTSGTVDFYVPGTTTRKTTWQDSAETIANTNPVVLDGSGRALIWGDGSYRQVIKDRYGNLIWDQVTSSIGSGSGGSTTVGDGLPVGTILPWSGLIAPSNYQFAYGQALSRTTYAALLANISLSTAITCVGGSSTITNISDTTSINIGAVLESVCVIGSPTVISKTATTVTLSANANVSVSTTGRFFIFGNGDGLTTFNVPDYRGITLVGRCNMGGVDCLNITPSYFSSNLNNTPSSLNAKGGNQNMQLLANNLPAHNHPVFLNDPGHTHGFSGFASSNAGVNGGLTASSTGQGNAIISSNTTGITIRDTPGGGGNVNQTANNVTTNTAFSLIQPSNTVNYIIKVSQSSSSAIVLVPSGGTSVPLFSTGVPGADPVYRAITGADLPNPSTLSLGGVFAKPQVAGQVIGGIDAAGTPQAATSAVLTTNDTNCLTVGRQGLVTPVIQVDCSAASQVTGIKLTGQASGNGFNIETIGETNVPLTINAKGTGTINFGTNSTGNAVFFRPMDIQGSSSGSTVLQASATASGTLTLPAATDTLIGKATTDIFTNKSISGSTNTLSNIALSSHATQGAFTFVGNNTSGSAAPTAVDIAALTTKAGPAAGDYIMLSDQSALGAWKKATVSSIASAGSVSSIAGNTGAFTLNSTSGITNATNDIQCQQGSSSQFGCVKVDNVTILATSGVIGQKATIVSNSLSGNVNIVTAGTYVDGPSTAQGTSGTWWASGTVTIADTTTAGNMDCKLWDGTTVIASSRQRNPTSTGVSISLSGVLASPAGNIRISCTSNTTTSSIVFNATGNSKDSTLTVYRIQ